MKKLEKDELELVKKQQGELQQTILDIGVYETKKHGLLHRIAEINIDIDESKKILEAKYGTVSIDLETGVITELPDEEDKKDQYRR